jgi:hypothetical protein
MWELSVVARLVVTSWILVVLLAIPRVGSAWIENKIESSDTRLVIDPSGQATIEHRVRLHTNGNERFKGYAIAGVDPAAQPLPNSYIVPARDALSGSLDAAVPLQLSIRKRRNKHAGETSELRITVADARGVRRGRYVMVLRYKSDLRARRLLTRDGSMVRVRYPGLRFDDGLPNVRTTFVLPAAPTAPRAVENIEPQAGDDELGVPSVYLSEVRRGAEQDEIELLRTYAPAGDSVPWVIRVDQRALDPLPRPIPVKAERHDARVISLVRNPHARAWVLGAAGLLFFFYALLVVFKSRAVARLAREAGARVEPVVPLPLSLRAALAATAVVAGVVLQLLVDWPVWGALAMVAGCLLAAHGRVTIERGPGVSGPALRGPGRWLSVTEREALGEPPRCNGTWLDWSTRRGKFICLLSLVLLGVVVALVVPEAPWHAALLGFDAVAILVLFGTGMQCAMPPDPAVEPARFLRRLVKRLRAMPIAESVRFVPRIRIPHGAVDPDELRLLVVPRVPLRGLSGIEVGICYALGTGARVAMPEVLLRVVSDSPCDQAVAVVSRAGRVTPGRKADERVISLSPRFPTVRMTADIVAAVASRVIDREAVSQISPRAALAPPSSDTSGASQTPAATSGNETSAEEAA